MVAGWAGVPKRCPSRKCRKTSWNHLAEERPEKPPGKKLTVSAIERKMVRGPKNRLRSWSEPAIPKIDFRKRAAADDDDHGCVDDGYPDTTDDMGGGVAGKSVREVDQTKGGIDDGLGCNLEEHDCNGSDLPSVFDASAYADVVRSWSGTRGSDGEMAERQKGVDDGQLPDGPRPGNDDNGYLGQGAGDDACPERSYGECSVDRLRVTLRGDVPAEAETIVPLLIENPNAPGGSVDFNLLAEQVHRWPSEVDIVQELPIEEAIARYPDREDEIRTKVAEVVQEASDGREVEDSGVGFMLVRDAGDSLRGGEPDLHDGSGDGYSVDGDTSIETRVVVVDEYSEGYIPLSTRVPVVAQLWAPPADDS